MVQALLLWKISGFEWGTMRRGEVVWQGLLGQLRRSARMAMPMLYRIRRLLLRLDPRPYVCCVVVATDASQRVLLVRHTYGETSQWRLPGGTMRSRERAIHAAQRETLEEVDCELRDLALQQFHSWTHDGLAVEIWIVTATTSDEPRADGMEIAEARFFAPDALPDPLAPDVTYHLERVALRTSFERPVPAYVRPEFLQELHARRR